MAILSTIKKIRPYIKTATGYIKLKLFADDVVTNNGKTVQDEIDTINTNLSFKLGNKYLKLENGLVIQWGEALSGDNNYATINFEVPFINTDYSLTASPQYLNNSYITFETSCQKISNKTAYFYTRISNGIGGVHPASVNWIAIGMWK